MQKPEIARFFDYVSRTSRANVHEKRKRLAHALSEGKYFSIYALVRSIDGNTRDRVWVSQALKDDAIIRRENGALMLNEDEPMSQDEAELERAYRAVMEISDYEMSIALDRAMREAQARIERSRE